MEQQDRDMLILINERQQVQMKNQAEHIKETKDFYEEVLEKFNNHNNRIVTIEAKQRPMAVKIFAAIGSFFMGK